MNNINRKDLCHIKIKNEYKWYKWFMPYKNKKWILIKKYLFHIKIKNEY